MHELMLMTFMPLSPQLTLSSFYEQPELPVSPGLDERDEAFMERLRNLAHEALTWPHLGERQQLVWAAVLELDAVPLQDQSPLKLKVELTA